MSSLKFLDEAIPPHIWPARRDCFSPHRKIHGLLPWPSARNARRTAHALSHAPHFYSARRVAQSRDRHLLSTAGVARSPNNADVRVSLHRVGHAAFCRRILLRTKAHRPPDAFITLGNVCDFCRNVSAPPEWIGTERCDF